MNKISVSIMGLIIMGLIFSGSVIAVDSDDDAYVEPHLALPVAENFQQLAGMSRNRAAPILIMYSTEDCEFCARLENEVLGPMRLSGADPKRVIVRKVLMEEYETLRDFNGRNHDAETYAIQRGVEVVPTVALVDEFGNELVPKIVGYQTSGIYENYLEKAIDVSRELIEQQQE